MMAIIQNLCRNNPLAQRAWDTAQNMTRGKSAEQRKEIATNLAKEKGLSYEQLKELAIKYNINLP